MHLVDAEQHFNYRAKTHRLVFSNDLYSTLPKLISRYRYFMRIWRKPFRFRSHARRASSLGLKAQNKGA